MQHSGGGGWFSSITTNNLFIWCCSFMSIFMKICCFRVDYSVWCINCNTGSDRIYYTQRLHILLSIYNHRNQLDHNKEEKTALGHVLLASPYPEPVNSGWSSVHWNATGWPSVHWDITGWPSKYLHGTLEHHWKNLAETAPHWNATGESWLKCSTLECHWTNSNFCSLHWITTGGTVTAHTRPGTYS